MRLPSLVGLVLKPSRVLVLPALAAFFMAGCETTRISRLPDPRTTNFDRASLVEVLDEMDQRRSSVRTVIARLHVCLRDKYKEKEHGLSGVYLGDNKGNVRMQIRHGESAILDLAFRGETAEIWLPRKSRFFKGKRSDLKTASECELSLLAHIGNAHDLFFPRAWTDNAVERRRAQSKEDGREVVQVLERPGPQRKQVRRMVIASDLPVADKIEIFLHNQKHLGTVSYNDYRFPQPRAGKPEESQKKITYPGRVTLSTPAGRREIGLEVAEMLLNEPIPVEKFKIKSLSEEEDVRVQDLGAALRGGKALWE